jgi:hypothetical protein
METPEAKTMQGEARLVFICLAAPLKEERK